MNRASTVAISVLAALFGLTGSRLDLSAQSIASCGTWHLQEQVRVGSIDSPSLHSRVLGLEELADGRVLVAQALTPSLTILSRDGDLLGTMGRAGQGPGEFEITIQDVGAFGDTLWVTDTYKTQFFTLDFTYLDRARFARPVPHEGSRLVPGAPLRDGSMLARRQVTDYHLLMERVDPLPIRKLSRTGEILDTLATIPMSGRVISYETVSGGRNYQFHPLYDDVKGTLAGRYLNSRDPVSGGIVYVGAIHESHFEVMVVGLNGDTIDSFRVPYTPRGLTREENNRFRTSFGRLVAGDFYPAASRPPSRAVQERARRLGEEAYWAPAVRPPVRHIVAGHDGSIWILRDIGVEADRWEIYTRDGEKEGELLISEGRSSAIPWYPRLDILRASRNEIWAQTIDEFEIPYLHRFAVNSACDQ